VRIPTASGDELEAWLYLPGAGPHPVVVMAHGIGAIKSGGLAPFAERFCARGSPRSCSTTASGAARPGSLARSFPSTPARGLPHCHRSAAARPDIDAHRVFAWGTSFAGMYVVDLAVSDSRLAGAIGQSPLVDGFRRSEAGLALWGLRLLAVALLDRLGSVFGRPPIYLPGAGRPGELAIGATRTHASGRSS